MFFQLYELLRKEKVTAESEKRGTGKGEKVRKELWTGEKGKGEKGKKRLDPEGVLYYPFPLFPVSPVPLWFC